MVYLSFAPFVAATALVLFAGLAAYDGLFIHLWKLELHRRPQSYVEHLWHTASAVLFVPLVALLFVGSPSGAALWTSVGLIVLMTVVELFDVGAEGESRADLGGLAPGEKAIHIAAFVSRSVAIVLVLLSRPVPAWRGEAIVDPSFAPVHAVGAVLLIGSVGVAAIHLWLAVRHRPRCVSGSLCGAC